MTSQLQPDTREGEQRRAPTPPTARGLTALVTAVRAAVAKRADWADTAELVASALERHLPSPSILTADQRTGNPETYKSEVLHSEPDGSFSIVALVWRPGQVTPIHDHVTCHGDSARPPEEQFVRRGIDDVAPEELSYVVERLSSPPIIIAHSRGAMAALLYAASNPVERLVLLTPVVPSSVGADPIDIDVELTKPFGVPYDLARLLFYPTLDQDLARMYHALLDPESPRAVWQATRWTIDVDLQAVTAPTLVFATELDILTPPAAVAGLAELMGAPYELIPAIGHSEILLKRPEAIAVAERIRDWLDRDLAR